MKFVLSREEVEKIVKDSKDYFPSRFEDDDEL
jgi:hypothetical protein